MSGQGYAKTPEHDNIMNVLHNIHNVVTNNNGQMASYNEHCTVSLNNKTYSMSNLVLLYDIGNGYKIFHEDYQTNDKQKTSVQMLSPDGRLIDINFLTHLDL